MNDSLYQIRLRPSSQRGVSIIEFVVILPLLLLLFWALATFTNLLHAQMILARATEDAARSVSFLSGATTVEQLEAFLAPCTALGEVTIQCEALASLASSSLIKGADMAARFAQLKDEVTIEVGATVCSTDSSSLGVRLQLPLELIRILPSTWHSIGWMPSHLTACAVVAL